MTWKILCLMNTKLKREVERFWGKTVLLQMGLAVLGIKNEMNGNGMTSGG